MNQHIITGANKLLRTTEKENAQKSNFLCKKLEDQRKQLICEENARRFLLIKRLNMLRQNIVKAQEKASSQARLLHEYNLQKVGFKNQIKTQKMYFDLFEGGQSTRGFQFSLQKQSLGHHIRSRINESRRKKSRTFRMQNKTAEKGKKKLQLPQVNSLQVQTAKLRTLASKIINRRSFSKRPTQRSKTSSSGLMAQCKMQSRQDALSFIKSHVNSSDLVPFSVTYQAERRRSLAFLRYLKSLPYVCQYFLSRIQAKEVPVNVVNRGAKQLYDLRKVHEILSTLRDKKQIDRSKGLCEMYDDNLNLLVN